MQTLFEASAGWIGLQEFSCAAFDTVLLCIRFQIGSGEDIYLGYLGKPNGDYIETAVDRALQIYARLPA